MQKTTFFFLVIFNFFWASQASAFQCNEFFLKDSASSVAAPPKSIEQVHQDSRLLFYRMPVAQRIQVLDKMIEQVEAKITPEPKLLQRLWSQRARDQHTAHRETQLQLAELQRVREMFVWIEPLVAAVLRRGDFFKDDEIQLLNRVVESEKLFESVKFLSQRFRYLSDKSSYEKKFLDSVLYYLTWGPDAVLFPVPFHHWILFDILSSRQNPVLLNSLSKMLFESGDIYKESKNQISLADSKVEDYWLIQQDPVFKIVEQTAQRVDDAIEKAIDNGTLGYDENSKQLRLTSER